MIWNWVSKLISGHSMGEFGSFLSKNSYRRVLQWAQIISGPRWNSHWSLVRKIGINMQQWMSCHGLSFGFWVSPSFFFKPSEQRKTAVFFFADRKTCNLNQRKRALKHFRTPVAPLGRVVEDLNRSENDSFFKDLNEVSTFLPLEFATMIAVTDFDSSNLLNYSQVWPKQKTSSSVGLSTTTAIIYVQKMKISNSNQSLQ